MWLKTLRSLEQLDLCISLNMDQSAILILIPLAMSAQFGKYVYESQSKNWLNAQTHCRNTYTDLAPVSNRFDMDILHGLADNNNNWILIGLRRNSTDHNKWMWSGGGDVYPTFWVTGEPNNWHGNEDYGALRNYSWNDVSNNSSGSFFCYKVNVVRELKTWEEALQYCRENHRDLASVASETEMMLIQKELRKNDSITENVWIGLHFLAGDWMWVDRQPYEYEAWGLGGRLWCPDVSMECGAVQVSRMYDKNEQNVVASVDLWNAHNCDEKFYFLCY